MPIMKQLSLNELNLNGQIICSFKQRAYPSYNSTPPVLFRRNNPNFCYLHFYRGSFVVTTHILHDRQFVCDDIEDAISKFKQFIDNTLYL